MKKVHTFLMISLVLLGLFGLGMAQDQDKDKRIAELETLVGDLMVEIDNLRGEVSHLARSRDFFRAQYLQSIGGNTISGPIGPGGGPMGPGGGPMGPGGSGLDIFTLNLPLDFPEISLAGQSYRINDIADAATPDLTGDPVVIYPTGSEIRFAELFQAYTDSRIVAISYSEALNFFLGKPEFNDFFRHQPNLMSDPLGLFLQDSKARELFETEFLPGLPSR